MRINNVNHGTYHIVNPITTFRGELHILVYNDPDNILLLENILSKYITNTSIIYLEEYRAFELLISKEDIIEINPDILNSIMYEFLQQTNISEYHKNFINQNYEILWISMDVKECATIQDDIVLKICL